MDTKIIDKMSPDERHMPPSARRWARFVFLRQYATVALELRDPNSGLGQDPESLPRFQFIVARGRLWSRMLPPAALEDTQNEESWRDAKSSWSLVEPGAGLIWEWATEQGVKPYTTRPILRDGRWSFDSNNMDVLSAAFEMPYQDPFDIWADITSNEDNLVPCPADCSQYLVWYEAGYVPGYRVCMSHIEGDKFDPASIQHKWIWKNGYLVLDQVSS